MDSQGSQINQEAVKQSVILTQYQKVIKEHLRTRKVFIQQEKRYGIFPYQIGRFYVKFGLQPDYSKWEIIN